MENNARYLFNHVDNGTSARSPCPFSFAWPSTALTCAQETVFKTRTQKGTKFWVKITKDAKGIETGNFKSVSGLLHTIEGQLKAVAGAGLYYKPQLHRTSCYVGQIIRIIRTGTRGWMRHKQSHAFFQKASGLQHTQIHSPPVGANSLP